MALGPLNLEVSSNTENLPGTQQFLDSKPADDGRRVDHRVVFCDLRIDGPWPEEALKKSRDASYRSNRFSMGYYITDHFGSPAYLMTRGADVWVFGTDFESILWPYIVKIFLTVFSMERGMLHLKAASVAVNDAGALLVAKGGGGKTVLLTRLCEGGARYLSNTHTLIDGQNIVAVPTAMRVRNDELFGPIISTRRLPPAIKPGEYTVDPLSHLGWTAGCSLPCRSICLVDFQPGNEIIRELDREVLLDYMEQFSLALNVYGLKEDILDYLAGDIVDFSAHTSLMKSRLRELVDRCRAYYLSCDASDPATLRRIYNLLAVPRPVSS